MDNLQFLFGAYTAVWGMIFLYLWFMSKRTRRLEQQLEELLRALQERQSGGAASATSPREQDDTRQQGDLQCL